MKQLTAILFCALLVCTPFLSAKVVSPPCAKLAIHCGGSVCHMACCEANNSPGAKTTPAVPEQKIGTQNPISMLAPNAVAWLWPGSPANSILSAAASPLTVTGTALYARDCALLI